MIHFFSCIFTGNLRTSYIVIFPIFQQQTDPDKTSSSWGGRRGARNNTGAPGTLGATRPAESLLGFLPEKLPEKLHPCTGSRIKQKIFTLQFSKQSQQNRGGALVHWELCMLLIPWEAGFGYPTRTARGPKPRCSSALGLGHSVSSK